jgi:hypothetical protein
VEHTHSGTRARGPAPVPGVPAAGVSGARSILLGSALLSMPFAALTAASLAFAAGRALAPALTLVVLCAPVAWASLAARPLGLKRIDGAWAALGTLATLAVCCTAAARVLDLGFDSQSYHQLGILELAGGWNPISAPLSATGPYALYAGHYAIGAWTQAALVYLATGSLEAGKGLNLVLIAASACLAFGALRELRLLSTKGAAVIAACAALNPIAVSQCMTFYVDGALGSLLLALSAALALAVHTPRPVYLAINGALVALIATTKFTGVVYVVPLLAGAVFASWLRHGKRRGLQLAWSQAGAFALAVAGLGFHPYVTNTLRHGHPFYPLLGSQRAHDLRFLRPLRIADAGRIERLIISIFGDPARDFVHSLSITKWPLSLGPGELIRFGTPDPRVAGWGPYFSAALIICGVSAFAMLWQRRSVRRAPFAIIALLALSASALLNAECWWARFSPQLCLVPLVVAVALFSTTQRVRIPWALAMCVVAVSATNHGLVLGATLEEVAQRDAAVKAALDGLAARGATLYVSRRWPAPLFRLRERGISFVAVEDDTDDSDPALADRMPCAPLGGFPGSMGEVRFCAGPSPRELAEAL